MNTKEILSIAALAALGLCLLLGLSRMAMKKDSNKEMVDRFSSLFVFIAIVLLSVSQLLNEKSNFHQKETCPFYPSDNCFQQRYCSVIGGDTPFKLAGYLIGGYNDGKEVYKVAMYTCNGNITGQKQLFDKKQISSINKCICPQGTCKPPSPYRYPTKIDDTWFVENGSLKIPIPLNSVQVKCLESIMN